MRSLRTLLLANLVLAAWLAVGIWMVKSSVSQRHKEQAVLVVILVPLGAVAQHRLQAWADRKTETWNLNRPEPICPDCAGQLGEEPQLLWHRGRRRCLRCGRVADLRRRWFRRGSRLRNGPGRL